MKSKTISMERPKVDLRTNAKAVLIALLSFLFGAARLFGSISPFGAAIVAALPIKYALTGVVGAVVGSILFAPGGRTGYLAAVSLLVFAERLFLTHFWKRKYRPGALCLVTFAGNAVCAIAYGMLHPFGRVEMLLLGVEILLSSCLTYFFAVSGELLLRKQRPAALSYAQSTSLCILFISGICACANISFWGLNLGVILSVAAIYITISRYQIFGCCFCTVMAAIGLNLYSLDMLPFTGLLIAASFIAGAFAPLKKLGIVAAFIAVATFGLFLMGAPLSLTYRLIDIFLGSAIFVLLPERLLRRIGEGEGEIVHTPPGSQKNFAAKLAFASDTIKELEDELSAVSEKFREIDYNNIGTIYEAAAENVCRGCSRALGCWEKNYSETVNAFNPISDILRISGRIRPEDLPAYFRDTCCKPEQLCRAVNRYYDTFIQRQNEKRQAAEARRIVFEQFDSIADMLLEVSEEIGDVTGFDESMTKAVTAAYEKLEKKPEQIICPVDPFGRSRIEIYTTELQRTSPATLCQALSEAAGRDFELPSISRTQGMTRLSLCERASFRAELSYQQSCCGENEVCGDSCEYFYDAQGYVYLLISDGMGNGKRAAVDSRMTCSILEKLIKAGFGIAAAVRLLNSSLLIRSTDESLATIDLAKIDLYTGQAEFYKAGAAVTFLWTGNELVRVESGALPVGILEGAGLDKHSIRLHKEDLIVMVSDGAVSAGEGWLAETIRQNGRLSAKELAILLCREAKERCESIHPDDITVLAARLKKDV